MKKYSKPTVEVVELSVKESLSAIPTDINKYIKSVTRPATGSDVLFATTSYS